MINVIQIIFALIGLAILLFAIVGAVLNRDADRWAEGLLLGVYIGALGCISAIAILTQFGILSW
jgi:hypothetical protein